MVIRCINIIATWLLTATLMPPNFYTIVFDNEEGFEVRNVKLIVEIDSVIVLLKKSKLYLEIKEIGIFRLCSDQLLHQVISKIFEHYSEAERADVAKLTGQKEFYSNMCLGEIKDKFEMNDPMKLSEYLTLPSFCEPQILTYLVANGNVRLIGEHACFALVETTTKLPEEKHTHYPISERYQNSKKNANHIPQNKENIIPTVIADAPFYNPMQLRKNHGVVFVRQGITYRLYLMGSLLQVVVLDKKGEFIYPCFRKKKGGYYTWQPSRECQKRPDLSARIQYDYWDKSPYYICAPPPIDDAVNSEEPLG